MASYDAGDVTVELAVPDTWADSGYGIWWREADPVDTTNLDVYVWDAVDAEATRSEVATDWGLDDPELTSTQIGDRIWLFATGTVGIDTVYQIATSRIDDRNIAVILESGATNPLVSPRPFCGRPSRHSRSAERRARRVRDLVVAGFLAMSAMTAETTGGGRAISTSERISITSRTSSWRGR